MQIHQVERDSTLQIPLDPIDGDLPADVHNPTKADAGLGDGLVDTLILLNPLTEIALSVLFRHAGVVWVARRHFERNVGRDHGRVIAVAFQEKELQVGLLGETGLNLGSSIACRIGGV